MTSNNGSTIYKVKFFSFINRGRLIFVYVLLLLFVLPCSWLIFNFWHQIPLLLKIFWPLFLAIISVTFLFVPLNGIFIGKNKIVFFPDIRVKTFEKEEIKRIAIIFSEWKDNRYSASVKVVMKNGAVFSKDYAAQYREIRNNRLPVLVYSLKKNKVDKLIDSLNNEELFNITLINSSGDVLFQRTQD